jgi:hypothetical protein
MAHTDTVPPGVQTAIASQISDLISTGAERAFLVPDSVPVNFGETFTVWKFKPRAIAKLKEGAEMGDLKDSVVRKPQWHHQVKFGGEGKAFARSMYPEADPSDVKLCHLNVSEFAEDLNAAIYSIDDNALHDPWLDNRDPVARLLEIPSYHVDVLWLLDEHTQESRVLVLDAPRRCVRLVRDRLLSSKEFLQALVEAEPLAGVS